MNKLKTIMICVPDLLRKNGGPTVSILKQINLLHKKNYKIYLFTLTIDSEIYKDIKAKTFILEKGNFFDRSRKLLKALVLITKVDYLHIHSFWTKFVFLILLFCKMNKKRVFITPHGMLTKTACQNNKFKIIFRDISNFLLHSVKKFHFLTDGELQETLIFLKKKKLPNIVQPNWLSKINYGDQFSDKQFLQNKKNIVFIGRIHPVKRIEMQIILISKLKKENIICFLNLIGPIDQNYVTKLKLLSTELDVAELVIFKGPIYGLEKSFYLVNADINILTSIHESSSVSALEILQLGGILLATKSCSLSFAAKKGALYESSENINDLIHNIKLIFKLNEDEKAKLRQRAKNYIGKYHNEEIAFQKFNELYFQ